MEASFQVGRIADYIGEGGTGWKWNSAERIKFRAPSLPAANPPGVPTHSVGFSLFRPTIPPQKRSDLSLQAEPEISESRETCELNGRSIRYFYRSNSILPYERSLYTVLLCVFILGKSFRGKLAAIDRVYPFRYSFLRRLAGNKGSPGITELCLGVVRVIYLLLYFILLVIRIIIISVIIFDKYLGKVYIFLSLLFRYYLII